MKLKGYLCLFCCFSVSLIHKTQADEVNPLVRSAKAQAMGNAWTAIANDDQAIFYNPAGLAGVQEITFNLLSTQLECSQDLLTSYSWLKNSLTQLNLTTLNQFVGKNLYSDASAVSSLLFPGFQIAALYDAQFALRLNNLNVPQGIWGAQVTYGLLGGFGLPILQLKKKKGTLRIGMATKLLWRSGGYQRINLTDLFTLDKEKLLSKFGNFGYGLGADIGIQFQYKINKKFTFFTGSALLDIGDTSFSTHSDSQKSNLAIGLGLQYQYADLKTTLAYDLKNILTNDDWNKKNHFGIEMKFPFLLSLYGGINQIYLTYGASLNFLFLKFTYLSYKEEQMHSINMNPEQRTLLQLALNLNF